jgi:hypothetical protein
LVPRQFPHAEQADAAEAMADGRVHLLDALGDIQRDLGVAHLLADVGVHIQAHTLPFTELVLDDLPGLQVSPWIVRSVMKQPDGAVWTPNLDQQRWHLALPDTKHQAFQFNLLGDRAVAAGQSHRLGYRRSAQHIAVMIQQERSLLWIEMWGHILTLNLFKERPVESIAAESFCFCRAVENSRFYDGGCATLQVLAVERSGCLWYDEGRNR